MLCLQHLKTITEVQWAKKQVILASTEHFNAIDNGGKKKNNNFELLPKYQALKSLLFAVEMDFVVTSPNVLPWTVWQSIEWLSE